ncbi:MAG: 4a-hydroxytetrahydrobiopterin dehydratase [Dehalococcoidia bacterium]
MAELLTPEQVAEALASLPGWKASGNSAISKTFTLGDHITAMGFVTRVAMAAEVMNHHPDLRIVYSRVDITLNTHDAGGVTERDIELARRIEQYA